MNVSYADNGGGLTYCTGLLIHIKISSCFASEKILGMKSGNSCPFLFVQIAALSSTRNRFEVAIYSLNQWLTSSFACMLVSAST